MGWDNDLENLNPDKVETNITTFITRSSRYSLGVIFKTNQNGIQSIAFKFKTT